MVDYSREIGRAEDVLRRVQSRMTPGAMRARKRRVARFFRRLKIAVMAVLASLFAAGLYGALVTPLGVGGVMTALLGALLLFLIIIFWPGAPEPTAETLVQTDLKLLPRQTEDWLERQRPALPAPASQLIDGIGVRLDALTPQLQTLDPREPAAIEIRKLIGEELPELVNGYHRVPANLRREGVNGMSPDRQLLDGLAVVESELGRMGEQLASGDLHRLATQGRYLEIKYRGDPETE